MSVRMAIGCAAASVALLTGCNGGGDPDANGDRAPDAALGQDVFTQTAVPSCGTCHVLDDAGTTGAVGPDLDDLQPSRQVVEQAVRNGPGVMPSYGSRLSDEEIEAVAAYVEEAAGG